MAHPARVRRRADDELRRALRDRPLSVLLIHGTEIGNGLGSSSFYLFIGIDGNCGNYLKYNGATWEQFVNPPEIGETDLPMSPGLVIPSGDSLCAGTDGIDVDITVSGYTVARSAVL
jgi:hypothetical protein